MRVSDRSIWLTSVSAAPFLETSQARDRDSGVSGQVEKKSLDNCLCENDDGWVLYPATHTLTVTRTPWHIFLLGGWSVASPPASRKPTRWCAPIQTERE